MAPSADQGANSHAHDGSSHAHHPRSSPHPAPPPPAYSQATTPNSSTAQRMEASAIPPISLQNDGQRHVLPPLSQLAGVQSLPIRTETTEMANYPPQWSTPSALTAQEMPAPPAPVYRSDFRSLAEADNYGSNSVSSVASSEYRADARSASVNIDDPDVRIAAEALGDLRADFVSSPSDSNAGLPLSPPSLATQLGRSQSQSHARQGEVEPLFSLLTTSHPLLATTIENASSAYGGAKNFSPRFKSSAEYVEGYLSPIANTVGSVGRVTGVEGGVRWFLGAGRRQNSDVEASSSSKKRRKVNPAESEPLTKRRLEAQDVAALIEVGKIQDAYPGAPRGERRPSFASTTDTLPAYDGMHAPAYTETTDPRAGDVDRGSTPWQSRLIMSTSGLSVAMSDESLRSLKYCLKWLRWANGHMGGVIGSLKTTLEQYDKPRDEETAPMQDAEKQEVSMIEKPTGEQGEQQPSRAELASRINTLKGDVLKTLHDAINMVSRYAGGALPENARVLVRSHLTSLPQRFRYATMSENQSEAQDSESAVREGAHKVLVLAKEGLDMVSQVSGIVDGTIVSAEEWCERMGRKKRDSNSGEPSGAILPQVEKDRDDVQMTQ
ncbi:transcription factor Opi1-domain-containing protein [Emericellopsis atlantica]|uniref:Transcription factor Opi1-domain-containing protein n=1 Tax=Emericellopsis atlantica TaxID=2614577 RepID=A0A9P8CMN1_9HYPO|nr:transcription factor Opi1-domain-containing protein [Emericellopsis atlantica]KAG9252195.1 transcription factor Opi1-domain-containing protein [Emericellopsis atlantica]